MVPRKLLVVGSGKHLGVSIARLTAELAAYDIEVIVQDNVDASTLKGNKPDICIIDDLQQVETHIRELVLRENKFLETLLPKWPKQKAQWKQERNKHKVR